MKLGVFYLIQCLIPISSSEEAYNLCGTGDTKGDTEKGIPRTQVLLHLTDFHKYKFYFIFCHKIP